LVNYYFEKNYYILSTFQTNHSSVIGQKDLESKDQFILSQNIKYIPSLTIQSVV